MFKEAFSKLKKSPEEAERLIRMLTNEEDRVSAREQLALVQAAGKTEKNLPPSDWLKSLGSPGQSRNAAYRFAQATATWSEAQVSEFRTAFDSMEQTEKKNVAMILSSGGQGDDGITGDAIRYLVRNPPEPKTDDVGFRSGCRCQR